jgi:hypothetical protein
MTLENDTLRRTSIENPPAVITQATAAPAYGSYAQGTYRGAAQPMAYGGPASPYNQSPYSQASTPSSTGDPSPSSAWPYDDPTLQGQYDPRYWGAQQGYSGAYAQQYEQQWDDGEEEDDDDGEEEQEEVRPSHASRRRR